MMPGNIITHSQCSPRYLFTWTIPPNLFHVRPAVNLWDLLRQNFA